jgi:hypothetical protein
LHLQHQGSNKIIVRQIKVIIDSNHRARIPGHGTFLRTCSNQSSNLRADLQRFGRLFYEVSFDLGLRTD